LFGPDGRSLYLVTTVGREYAALAVAPLDRAGRPSAPTLVRARDDADLQTVVVSRRGDLALLAWNVGGGSRLEVVDLRRRRVLAEPDLPEEAIWGADLSPDGGQALLTLAGSTSGPSLWALDLPSLRMTPLLRPAGTGGVRPT